MPSKPQTMLVLSQVYVPDPASVGQHVADAAAAMARRGHRVVVLCARSGYGDPSTRYPARERRDGVEVRRLPLCSFGKASLAHRVLGGLLFVVQCTALGLFTRRLGCIFVTTVPPMCPLAALLIAAVRRVPIKYWIMDINPDQAVATGRLSPSSPAVRALDALNRLALRRSADVVALDRFMATRLLAKADIGPKLSIIPPWPHEDHLERIEHAANPFRQQHGLADKFVIMYSGNHSPSNPIQTILDAARRLEGRPNLIFMFIGDGVDKAKVDRAIAAGASNLRSLPYQPLDELKYSLSAADVHLVTMGDDVVGIIHPCKVYGAMTVARPILFLGPDSCHATDLIREHRIGWHVAHGDVTGAVATIEGIVDSDPDELQQMGRRAQSAIDRQLSKQRLCDDFCGVLERGLAPPRRAA